MSEISDFYEALKQLQMKEQTQAARQEDLHQVKILSLRLNYFGQDAQVITLLRDFYETCVYISIQLKDMDSFQRHVAMCKTYYYDFSAPSEKMATILGLNMTYLLACRKTSDFHKEMENLSRELINSVYIQYPIKLETYFQGNYSKVLDFRQQAPQPQYAYFVEQLMDTVRFEIAYSLESAYKYIEIANISQLLMIQTQQQLQDFITKMNENSQTQWTIQDTKVVFMKVSFQKQKVQEAAEIPSSKLISNSLKYAIEVERIV